MSGPITYDPMPNPTLADACDGVDAFSDVATVADANFDRVNAFYAGRGNRATFIQTNLTANSGPLPGSGDSNLNAKWPPLTFTVPTNCLGVLLMIRANLVAVEGTSNLLNVFTVISGAGLRVPVEGRLLEIMCTGAFFNGGRSLLIRGVDLVAGGQVKVEMWCGRNAAGGGGNTHVDGGWLQGLILRGVA